MCSILIYVAAYEFKCTSIYFCSRLPYHVRNALKSSQKYHLPQNIGHKTKQIIFIVSLEVGNKKQMNSMLRNISVLFVLGSQNSWTLFIPNLKTDGPTIGFQIRDNFGIIFHGTQNFSSQYCSVALFICLLLFLILLLSQQSLLMAMNIYCQTRHGDGW